MPRGDKSSYTDKQKRQAEHIEQGYEQRGVSRDEASRLGDGQQGNSRRAEERLGSRQDRGSLTVSQRRSSWRKGIREPSCVRAFAFGQEGRPDAQTARGLKAHSKCGRKSRVKSA